MSSPKTWPTNDETIRRRRALLAALDASTTELRDGVNDYCRQARVLLSGTARKPGPGGTGR